MLSSDGWTARDGVKAAPWFFALALLLAIAALQLSRLHHALGAALPAGDNAVFELNVRQALEGEQRVGPYSRGFYHPGPAYFYWLAIPYALLGRSSFALHAGAQILTLVFLAGIWAVAARRGPGLVALLLLVPLLGLELAYLGDFPEFDFWPPYVLFLGYALFVLLAAAFVAGELAALAPLVALASFLIQTHVAYAPAVASATIAVFVHAFATRPELRRGHERRHLVWGAIVLAVFWAIPVHAELFQGQGNLARLWRAFARDAGPAPVWKANLADAVALELTGPWQYALFRDRFIVPDAPKHYIAARSIAFVLLGLLVLARRRAQERGDRFTVALCVISVGSLLIAVLSLTRIRGAVAPHHTAWISALGVTSAFAVISAFAPGAAPRWAPVRPLSRFSVLAGGWLLLCAIWPPRIITAVHANPELRELTEHAAALIRAGPARARIGWSPTPRQGEAPPDALVWATSVMLELERRQIDFFTGRNPDLRWMLGRPRWEARGQAGVELLFFVESPPQPVERVHCVRGDNYFLRYPACVGVVTNP